jgi:hypothetical protein
VDLLPKMGYKMGFTVDFLVQNLKFMGSIRIV